MNNSPYLNQDPRTVDEAMRMIMQRPGMWSLFSPETRQWVKDELNCTSQPAQQVRAA